MAAYINKYFFKKECYEKHSVVCHLILRQSLSESCLMFRAHFAGFGGAALILGYACGVAMGAPLVKTAENTTFGRR